jgi:hypothetical protein
MTTTHAIIFLNTDTGERRVWMQGSRGFCEHMIATSDAPELRWYLSTSIDKRWKVVVEMMPVVKEADQLLPQGGDK